MKIHILIFVAVMAAASASADNMQTYVDDLRGFSVAHPTTWQRSVQGQSVCFDSPEGPGVSMRIQPMPADENNYTSIFDITGAENEMILAVKSIPGASTITNGRTKLSGRDALWINYRVDYESLDTLVYIFNYQLVTLTSRGLLYCTYMATGNTEQEAKTKYDRVWNDAHTVIRSLFVHQ